MSNSNYPSKSMPEKTKYIADDILITMSTELTVSPSPLSSKLPEPQSHNVNAYFTPLNRAISTYPQLDYIRRKKLLRNALSLYLKGKITKPLLLSVISFIYIAIIDEAMNSPLMHIKNKLNAEISLLNTILISVYATPLALIDI